MTARTEPWTEAERDAIVDAYYDVRLAPDDYEDGELERVLALYERYQPAVPISRSPLSERVLTRHLDPIDIDGPWWDHDAPRRKPDRGVRDLVAVTGAMELGGISPSPMVVCPGPAAPFVLPDLFEAGAVATLSSLLVGNHVGYVLCYFAKRPSTVGPRWNDWAAPFHTRRVKRETERQPVDEDPDRRNFDLARWIEQGSLSWIAPADPDLGLRTDLDECPYLDLGVEAARVPRLVQHGRALPLDAAQADPVARGASTTDER